MNHAVLHGGAEASSKADEVVTCDPIPFCALGSGWVNLYKPSGVSSAQALKPLQRWFKGQKVGHAGTLDPLAVGVLPVAIGSCTRLIPYIQHMRKQYRFVVAWGSETTTGDREGEVIRSSTLMPTQAAILAALPGLCGQRLQVPHPFSSKKVQGKRAYRFARSGTPVALDPVEVEIECLTLLERTETDATFEVTCGKGTYVRSLALELAQALDTCATVMHLERIGVGEFHLQQSVRCEDKNQPLCCCLLPVQWPLTHLLRISLTEGEAKQILLGQKCEIALTPSMPLAKTSAEPTTCCAMFGELCVSVGDFQQGVFTPKTTLYNSIEALRDDSIRKERHRAAHTNALL